MEEVSALDGLAWVTAGREVENYLSAEVLRRKYPDMIQFPKAFDDVAEFLERYSLGEGKRFERNKVLFAESVIPLMKENDLADSLDLSARIIEASQAIASWNRIEPTWI
jgi:hypothetical protein